MPTPPGYAQVLPPDRLLLLCALIAPILGCGDDQSQELADAAPPALDAEAQACTFAGFASSTELAERDDEIGVLLYTASSGVSPAIELLTFDLYFSLGANETPHEFSFSGQNLADCHTCLMIRRDCMAGNCSSGKAVLAQEGSATIPAIGAAGMPLQGTLSNIKFAEVTINIATQRTTLVPGGDTWCIDRYDFDQNVTGP